ncbi:MAG: ABC transporter permease [Lachnospiraceae bacterium]|nr:ABC transporter permease [Lachnospiraceae bacterium]
MNKEPLFHITRNSNIKWYKAWIIRAIAIILALILCGIITSMTTGLNPIGVYGTMIDGVFGTSRRIWMLLQNMAILLCISLALAPAFKMKFWNLGGDGQSLMGALGAAAVMILLGDRLPSGLLIIVMIVVSILCGIIWAVIPAFFKAVFNTNETLFTLMMNYVAIQLVAFFVIVWEVPRGSGKIGIINQNTQAGWFPSLFGSKYMINLLVVIILTVLIYVYMNYTKHGYELAVVGESEATAKYVGIKTKRVVIRTMVLSGALCGIAGLLLVGGSEHTLTTTLVDGRGFTGVMVAWLAKFNPLVMILTTFLLVFLDRGATEITTIYGLNDSFGAIITGIILFFILGSEFFLNYRIAFRKSGKEAA